MDIDTIVKCFVEGGPPLPGRSVAAFRSVRGILLQVWALCSGKSPYFGRKPPFSLEEAMRRWKEKDNIYKRAFLRERRP